MKKCISLILVLSMIMAFVTNSLAYSDWNKNEFQISDLSEPAYMSTADLPALDLQPTTSGN